jgi:RNA polymerase sigma-70 factor, ECF subfamily
VRLPGYGGGPFEAAVTSPALPAPGVRLVGDGGGLQKAPLRVIESAAKVGRFLHAISETPLPGAGFTFREVNGAPAVVITSHGIPHTVLALEVTGGLVSCVYLLTNPQKLGGVRSREAEGA